MHLRPDLHLLQQWRSSRQISAAGPTSGGLRGRAHHCAVLAVDSFIRICTYLLSSPSSRCFPSCHSQKTLQTQLASLYASARKSHKSRRCATVADVDANARSVRKHTLGKGPGALTSRAGRPLARLLVFTLCPLDCQCHATKAKRLKSPHLALSGRSATSSTLLSRAPSFCTTRNLWPH